MSPNRWRLAAWHGWAAVVVGLAMMSLPHPVRGQAITSLPVDITSATATLSAEQRRVVNQFLTHWIRQLIEGEAAAISEARQKLTDPLRTGSSFFKTLYSAELSRELRRALNSPRLVVRLNAMIVVTYLIDPGAVDLMLIGLNDASPAPRYWAAKAVTQVAANVKLTESQQRQLLESLTTVLGKEPSEQVLQQVMRALGVLEIEEAAPRLLTGLNQRVPVHAEQPELSLGAELEGLRSVLQRLIDKKVNSQVLPAETVRQLTLVAARYLRLSAAMLQSKRTDPAPSGDYLAMVKRCDDILNWSIKQPPFENVTLGGVLARPIDELLQAKDWNAINLRAAEWYRVLERLNFKRTDLDVPLSNP